MYTVIAYDITDARRLHKVARIMEDYGRRVQFSVFEADISRRRLAEIQQRVANTIDDANDGVKYFPLCERCLQHVAVYGVGELPAATARYLVL